LAEAEIGSASVEQTWLSLSEALDAADDREVFLTRLALLLGRPTRPEAFGTACANAAPPPERGP
jgi:hypothetical protein